MCLLKEIPVLKELDALLKCGICYEDMKTSMVTPCSHNYCSLCIRKSLLYKTECPSCFKEVFENQLHNNRIIDEIIDIFTRLKEELKSFLQGCKKQLQTSSFVNIKPTNELLENSDSISDSYTRMGGKVGNKSEVFRNTKSLKSQSVSVPTTSFYSSENGIKSVVDDDDFKDLENMVSVKKIHTLNHIKTTPKSKQKIPLMFSPKKNRNVEERSTENLVSCPVCAVGIPESNINKHLDVCLKRSDESVQNSNPVIQKKKTLPKLVYSLLQEKELRKKLKEHGLSTQGDRKTLISRHQRFTLLYNSECDSLNPRTVADIVQQIEKEEREEKKLSSTSLSSMLKIDRKTDPKIIEQAQHQYLQQNKNSFDNLIQAMRKREKEKKPATKCDLLVIDEDSDSETLIRKHTKKGAEKKTVSRILSDDEDSGNTENKNNPHELPKRLSSETEMELDDRNCIENMDETTFDMNYDDNSNETLSPVLGRNMVTSSSKRENEKYSGVVTETSEMFLTSLSPSSHTRKSDYKSSFSENKATNTCTGKIDGDCSDADSNESMSLLADNTQDSPQRNRKLEERKVIVNNFKNIPEEINVNKNHEYIDDSCSSVSGTAGKVTFKRNSQLQDPDFEPYFEEMSEEFEIAKPNVKRKRNKRKSPPLLNKVITGEKRTLRKRDKL